MSIDFINELNKIFIKFRNLKNRGIQKRATDMVLEYGDILNKLDLEMRRKMDVFIQLY